MTTAADTQPLMRANEVARRLAVSTETVYRMSRAGLLPGIRLKPLGPLRFRVEDVEALIERGMAA